jgi:hypothetical protein
MIAIATRSCSLQNDDTFGNICAKNNRVGCPNNWPTCSAYQSIGSSDVGFVMFGRFT